MDPSSSSQPSIHHLPASQSPPPSNNPSPDVSQAPTSSPAIPPLYLDNLAREFGLGDRDRMKLRGLVQVTSAVGLSQGQLFGPLYILAVVLSEAAERRRQAQENTFAGDLRAMMRDLQIRLDDGFALTAPQKDVIHEATRTVFTTMHVDVLVILKDKMKELDLDNIFGVPIREKKLAAALKRACSSVRNAFRQDIRDSIDPASFIVLEKFTYSLASKYKQGGVVGELSDLFTIHAALLRRFAFDHPDLLWVDEVADGDSEMSPSPPAKKRKAAQKQGDRIPAGQDFWGMVDVYFKREIANRGRSFKDVRWKPYIDQILADDTSKFAGLTPGMPVSTLILDPVVSGFSGSLSQFGNGTGLGTGSDFNSAFGNGNTFGGGGSAGSWDSTFTSVAATQ
ncbi:hypothetical protein K438DRAFT_1976680 [Mycena galopus ATCC 62051]|nr:hypothetical protein K438DRAFT_1976680 [Mycena galopus ATCC 62051]